MDSNVMKFRGPFQVTEGGTYLSEPIKAPFLAENPDDLLSIYGTQIPGEWFCLGIIDSLNSKNHASSPFALRRSVDDLANIMRGMFVEGATHSVIPILVFRELSLLN